MRTLLKQAIMAAYNWRVLPGSATGFLIRRLGLAGR